MPPPPLSPTSTDARVLRKQVAALYATMPASTVVDALLAWGLCAFMYWQTRDGGVLVWLGRAGAVMPVQPERLLQALADLSTTSAGPEPSPQ